MSTTPWTGIVETLEDENIVRGLVTKLSGVVLRADGNAGFGIPWKNWYNPEGDAEDPWEHQLHEACHVALSGVRFAEEEATLLLEMMILFTQHRKAIERFAETNISWHKLFSVIFSPTEDCYVDAAQATWSKGRGEALDMAALTFKILFKVPYEHEPICMPSATSGATSNAI